MNSTKSLRPYLVPLYEKLGADRVIRFWCMAVDAVDARAQAVDAFPDGEPLNCHALLPDQSPFLKASDPAAPTWWDQVIAHHQQLPAQERLRNVVVSSLVWWEDPDDGFASGCYKVTDIPGGRIDHDEVIVSLLNDAGSEAEVFASELYLIAPTH